MSFGLLKNEITYKWSSLKKKSYLSKQDLELNNPQVLICHKTSTNPASVYNCNSEKMAQ